MRTKGQASRRLTARAWCERTSLRVVLGWEGKGDAAEIIVQPDGRLNVADLEACVDLTRHFKFRTDVKDAVIQSISVDAAHGPVTRGFRKSLPGKCEAWNADLEKRDATRADFSCDIGCDA